MEERRKDDIEIRVLRERVENWMSSTTEYRKALCDKMDKINEKMNLLPCRERVEHTNSIKLQLKAIWVIISAGILGIIAEWIKLK